MNNEPVALTQGDILGILQDANSVALGQPIFNSSEEYNKLKAIIESAIRYTHPVKEQGNPVAWRSKDRDGYWCIYQSPVEGAEPLYTGFKELTDEDLEIITEALLMVGFRDEYINYDLKEKALAILRKAQET